MNRQLIAGIVGGFVAGAVAGGVLVRTLMEQELREDYDHRVEIMKGAYERALALQMEDKAEEPAVDENQLKIDIFVEDNFTESAEKIREGLQAWGASEEIASIPEDLVSVEVPNPYHKAIEALETPVEVFVEGGINDYGVSYIEDEDFLDDDGRVKYRVDIMMEGPEPLFVMEGQPIDDWDKRLGDSILVDFFRLVPPGIDPVLYVRNHRTNEDYEVVQVLP